MTHDQMLDAIRQWQQTYFPGQMVSRVRIDFVGGERHFDSPMPYGAAVMTPATARRPEPAARHSPDFRTVHWFGADYSFTGLQAAIVRALWDAWQEDTPDVSQEKLLEDAGSETPRLRDLFRGHPAWGKNDRARRNQGIVSADGTVRDAP